MNPQLNPLHAECGPDTTWTTVNFGEANPGVQTPLGLTLEILSMFSMRRLLQASSFGLQLRLAPLRRRGQQLVGELARDGGAGLRDLLRDRAEPVEARR